ncbi:MAG TPA: glycosyltransferase family A protein [Dongiaceae bacterium]
MSGPAFTVLLPVHRPPALLRYAIASVQAQKRRDFELFVICDGAPPETAALARQCATGDARIRVFEHPKGEGNGELYRHQALQVARGKYVCQIADDDLWLPNHLTEMAILLRAAYFGHISMVWLMPDETLDVARQDLTDPAIRQRMLTENWNLFGPTTAGYRLSAYRDLPDGWSPAPREIASDLFMWRKFLARPELRVGTRYAITSAHFATPHRQDWPLAQREAEQRRWAERLADPALRRAFVRKGEIKIAGEILGQSSRLTHPLRTIADWLNWKSRA